VKAKTLLFLISFACAPTIYSFGQVDCTTSTNLVCQLPATTTLVLPFANNANYSAIRNQATKDLASINASVAAQLTQLPIPSATVGTVFLKQKGSDVPSPFDNLGPVLTDRPDTVGKYHLFASFSYQHFNFNAIDGIGLGAFPLGFQIPAANAANPNDILQFYVSDTNNVKFSLDQYVGILTYGATKSTDIQVVVPFNSVSLGVTSSGAQAYFYDPASQQYSNDSPPNSYSQQTTGTASGIGDVTVGVKQLLIGSEGTRAAIAAGATARFPSGDDLNYLGSGAWGGSVYGLFEYRGRIAPHLKTSYQWNNVSQLMDLQSAPHVRLPGGVGFDVGADTKLVRQLTVAIDLLGTQFVNTQSVAKATLNLAQATNGPVPPITSVTGLSVAPNTYSTSNFSAGLKWSPGAHVVFYGNVLIQINNVGLRSDPVPLFGISYNYKRNR
jgi:hypothetical protein